MKKVLSTGTLIFLLIGLVCTAHSFNRAPVVKAGKSSKRIVRIVIANNVIKKVEYGFSSANIRIRYNPQLDQLAKTAIDKNYALALRGYTDSIGNYTANWHLSEKRAAAVKNYLIKKGVNQDHIITTAFGSTKPVASNKTSKGRQHNRRVEIQLNDTQP